MRRAARVRDQASEGAEEAVGGPVGARGTVECRGMAILGRHGHIRGTRLAIFGRCLRRPTVECRGVGGEARLLRTPPRAERRIEEGRRVGLVLLQPRGEGVTLRRGHVARGHVARGHVARVREARGR
eukprot:1231793-Prymnesium_polylepis.1